MTILANDLRSQRQRIQVQGIVQGVGFRPFVYRLAQELHLGGYVYNDSKGVVIEIEGAPPKLDAFRRALDQHSPPLAKIDTITTLLITPLEESAFVISPSQTTAVRQALISPDVATCPDCLQELLDSADRRYGYPFINFTNCGPRFTIIQDVPYDRAKTTMRVFSLCPTCRAEYEDPLNRRFHAQPNACPECGPQVRLLDEDGRPIAESNESAIYAAVKLLVQGEIVAIKGLGGYHLACDALNETAVSRLRQRKHREAKPFALMVPDLSTAQQLCFVNAAEAALLQSSQRPIVLLRQRPHTAIAPSVAPAYNTLGIMLPYTPVHTLLFKELSAHLDGGPLPILVMTSGNVSDEPIAFVDEDAQQRLAPISASFLTHNRAIHMRCDDSVTRIIGESKLQILRRSRGYVPAALQLGRPCPQPVLAVGGHLKNTFCLVKDNRAFVSHHIGDLENLETLRSFEEGVAHFMRLFDIQPEVIACDMHPEYLSTTWAMNRQSINNTVPTLVPVQHHHAHIASVMAEHHLNEPVIGIAADGTGYGLDGAVWGGEIVTADLRAFERVAHLAYVPMPGGEQAIRQPWRMAAVYLQHTFGSNFTDLTIPFVQQLDWQRWIPLSQMIERNLNCPLTSSLGRLFDAVAALVGFQSEVMYEGQAAVELEMQALRTDEAYPFAIMDVTPAQIDVRPLIQAVVTDIEQGVAVPLIAGRFHRTMAKLITTMCQRVRQQTGLRIVVLSGGVFQNGHLLEQLYPLLEASQFQVYINHQLPPNDGGLSLGQAAVAAAVIQ